MANNVKDGLSQPLEQGGTTQGHPVDSFAVNRLDVTVLKSLAVRRIQSFRNLNCYIKQALEAYRLLTVAYRWPGIPSGTRYHTSIARYFRGSRGPDYFAPPGLLRF